MNIVKTTEDGWDCVPELKEVVGGIEMLDSYKYEINNCVRSSGLEDMVSEMKEQLQDVIDMLDEINVNREFTTIENEEF